MHWFWRATIAVAVAYLVGECVEMWSYISIIRTMMPDAPIAEQCERFLEDYYWHPSGFIVRQHLLKFSLYGVPIAVYLYLTRRFGPKTPDAETRCRKCGYILRGISEPRCPECGEKI